MRGTGPGNSPWGTNRLDLPFHSLYISARSSIFLSRLHTVHSCGFRSLRKFKINSSSFLSKRRGTLRHPSLWLFVLVMIKEKTIVIQTRRVYFRSFLSNWILTEDHCRVAPPPSPLYLPLWKVEHRYDLENIWLGGHQQLFCSSNKEEDSTACSQFWSIWPSTRTALWWGESGWVCGKMLLCGCVCMSM